jgi:hypothetical protein
MPERHQVAGDWFHGDLPPGVVYVGRQAPGFGRSKWHNPFKAGKVTPSQWPVPFGGVLVRDARHAVELFRELAESSPGYLQEVRADLAGRDLGCWCSLATEWCHARVLLELASPTGEVPACRT